MNDYVQIWSIAAGQGQMNFIEIIDGGTKTRKGLLLSDCGGTSRFQENSYQLVDEILKNNNQTINLVLISHTDADHCNLLGQIPCKKMNLMLYGCLIGKFNNTDLSKMINYLKSPAQNKLDRAEQAVNTNFINPVQSFDFKRVGIDTDVELKVVISNVGKSNANDASTIWMLSTGNRYAIFVGDATATTLGTANEKISDVVYNPLFVYPNICHFITLPHHGSLTTAGGSKSKHKDVKPCVTRFGNLIQAKSSVSSSDFHSGWVHSSEFVRKAIAPKLEGMEPHACYIHDTSNAYKKYLYHVTFFTNVSSYLNQGEYLSYMTEMYNNAPINMFYIRPNSLNLLDDYIPVKSPNPNPSKAKRIVSAVKISQERG